MKIPGNLTLVEVKHRVDLINKAKDNVQEDPFAAGTKAAQNPTENLKSIKNKGPVPSEKTDREIRIERIMESVRSGTYKVRAEEIAEKILKS